MIDAKKMTFLYCNTGFILLVIASLAEGQTIPVLTSPVSKSKSSSCGSVLVTKEIEEILKSQVNPYLTSRYGLLRNCGEHGWIKVVNFNMSDSSSTCPPGFTPHNTPVRSCGRFGDASHTTATFVIGEPYSIVCGRIIAIQEGSPGAFGPFYTDKDPTHYIDGITIRHGSTYNEGHVWSFAAGAGDGETRPKRECPCAHEQWNDTLPSFIGSDYFCETGNRGAQSSKVFLSDPLWNGKGCTTGNCCDFNNPPWFYKDLLQTTDDTLKVTLSINGLASRENIYITEMEIYVSP